MGILLLTGASSLRLIRFVFRQRVNCRLLNNFYRAGNDKGPGRIAPVGSGGFVFGGFSGRSGIALWQVRNTAGFGNGMPGRAAQNHPRF